MGRAAKRQWLALPVMVSVGQIWSTRPTHKGARERFVRIVGGARGAARLQQPWVTWREVTRSGKFKTPKSAPRACTYLTPVNGRWTMPSRWELV